MKPLADITGATVLRIPAIQSPNFSAGSAGWIIRDDGTSEFNSSVFRGNVVITSSQDLLVYSTSTPQPGTLLLAVAGSAGNDGLGNSWGQGFNVFDGAGNMLGQWSTSELKITNSGFGAGHIELLAQPFSTRSPLIRLVGDAGLSLNNSLIFVQTDVGVTVEILTLQGPTSVVATDPHGSYMTQEFFGGTGDNNASWQLQWNNASNVGIGIMSGDGTNGTQCFGQVIGLRPGVANPPTAETWHSAAPLLTSLWTTSGLNNPLRYRLEGVGGGKQVRFDGLVQTTGAGPWPAFGNILVFPNSLPTSGYIPLLNHHYVTRSAIAVAANTDTVIVVNNGSVQNGQAFTAAGQNLYFDGVTYPLD